MKKIIISGPINSASGYGSMCRFAYRSLKKHEDRFDIFIMATNWGNTGVVLDDDEETKEISRIITKTHQYIQQTGNQPSFDISIQVTIPNEFKKMAIKNIGYTAGIETNMISPAWLQPSQIMDKIIVISEHAKSGFVNTIFGDDKGNNYKIATPVEVCHFPVKDYEKKDLALELKHDFNFLTVCQWGPRKNLEQTIINFVEEFKNDNVGLVIKTNVVTDSFIDKDVVEIKLKSILDLLPKERKCTIHLLHGRMTNEELNSLYRHPKIKAIVSTTRGEGFGIPLFEAAYNELPVVATDWSGHLDFLCAKDEDGAEKKLFAKVDFEIKPIAKEHVWKGVLEEGTSWAYPVANSFKNRMREVYKDHGRFKSWAKKLNKWIRVEFEENKMFDKFANCVDVINNSVISVVSSQHIDEPINKNLKLGVLVPTFNSHGDLLTQCLDSISRQTYKNFDLFINDNNSTDKTVEYLESVKNKYNFDLRINTERFNAPQRMKYVFDKGIYDYITVIHSDDTINDDYFENLVRELNLHPDEKCLQSGVRVFGETGKESVRIFKYNDVAEFKNQFMQYCPVHCPTVVYRKDLHNYLEDLAHNSFGEIPDGPEDYDMWGALATKGILIYPIQSYLGYNYRIHPNQHTWRLGDSRFAKAEKVMKFYKKLWNL